MSNHYYNWPFDCVCATHTAGPHIATKVAPLRKQKEIQAKRKEIEECAIRWAAGETSAARISAGVLWEKIPAFQSETITA